MHRILVRRSSSYANVFRSSIERPEIFWAEQAEKISWFQKWDKVYDKTNLVRPHWFQDGQLNMTYNCLDRHISKHGNQTAIIHDSPMTGQVTHRTYKELLKDVKMLANVLSKTYSVKKGDVVLIYMPMIPEAIVAMLACARIGAIHNLVFGGFSANELAVRIKHSEPKLIISGKNDIRRATRELETVLYSFSERRFRTSPHCRLQNYCRRGSEEKWRRC